VSAQADFVDRSPPLDRKHRKGTTMRNKLMMTVALLALAMTGTACSLNVEQIMAVQSGSNMTIATTAPIPSSANQALEGGAVMNIDIFISLFDLFLGDFEGDIEVGEVLIAAPGFGFLGIVPTGIICVAPNATNPGGGTFEANLFLKKATFDVDLNTEAHFGNPQVANLLGGALPFPFSLVSTIPFKLSDALGLFSGSSSLTITQPINQPINLVTSGGPPFGGIQVLGSITGSITLASADAFPTSPLLDDCIEFLAQ
jgi:hypothetical protein